MPGRQICKSGAEISADWGEERPYLDFFTVAEPECTKSRTAYFVVHLPVYQLFEAVFRAFQLSQISINASRLCLWRQKTEKIQL